MDFINLFKKTWEQSKNNIIPLLISTLVLFVISFITLGILAPIAFAGYYSSILKMVRDGRQPQPLDIFSEKGLFLPLLIFGIAVTLLIMIGFALLIIPGILISIAIVYSCLYMIPLMVDKKLELSDALKESYAMTKRGSIVDHIVVLVIIVGLQALGSSFILGSFIATPMTTVFLMNVYDSKQEPE